MTNRAVSVAGLQTLGRGDVDRRRRRSRRARLLLGVGGRGERGREHEPARRDHARSPTARRRRDRRASRCSCALRRCTRWRPRRCNSSRATATSSSASASRRPPSRGSGTARATATGRSRRCASSSRCCRECLSGETVTFEGDFYTVKRFRLGLKLGDRQPKIALAALNKQMLRLGGELADAVLLNYLPASLVPWCVERVREGGDAEIYAYVHCAVTDRDRYADLARKDLLNYAVVDAYATQFARAGFVDEVTHFQNRWAERDRDGALAAISDEMGRRDPDHGRRRPRARRRAGVRRQRRRRPDRVRDPVGRRPPRDGQRNPPRSGSRA